MRAAMSMLWVAQIIARPDARTSWVSAPKTRSDVRGSREYRLEVAKSLIAKFYWETAS